MCIPSQQPHDMWYTIGRSEKCSSGKVWTDATCGYVYGIAGPCAGGLGGNTGGHDGGRSATIQGDRDKRQSADRQAGGRLENRCAGIDEGAAGQGSYRGKGLSVNCQPGRDRGLLQEADREELG